MVKYKIPLKELLSFLDSEIINVLGEVEDDIYVDNIADTAHTTLTTLDWIASYNPKKQFFVEQSKAKAILVDKEIVYTETLKSDKKILIVTKNPKMSFAKVGNYFFLPKSRVEGIHPTAIVDKDAKIGANVSIGAYCVIGKVEIGNNTQIDSNVKLYDDVKLGNHCIIKSGAVIGGTGFGFEKDENGNLFRFPQLGSVSIGNYVEIGANTCIDRGALSVTTIGDYTKIDNFCHIAHNVKIGRNVEMTCGCIIAGSSVIGDDVWLSLNTMIKDGIHVGNNVFIGMGVIVNKDVKDNETIWNKSISKHLDFRI